MAILGACSGDSIFAAESAAPPVRIEHFQTADGLPSNAIQTTVTDGDGYLWVATGQGLARFDGRQWRVFDSRNTPAFVTNEVRNLHLLRSGHLLVVLASGVFLRHAGGRFEPFAKLDFAVSQILEQTDGTLLLAGVKLISISPGQSPRTLIDNQSSGALVQLLSHGTRRFVLTPQLGDLVELGSDAVDSIDRWALEGIDADYVMTFLEDNALWIADSRHRWRLDLLSNRLDRFPQHMGLKPKFATRSADGWIWVGARSDPVSLCRLRSFAEDTPCQPIDIGSRNITAVSLGAHDDLWVSTWDAGLYRISAPPITLLAPANKLKGRVQSMLALQDGSVVVHSRNAALRISGETTHDLDWPVPADADDGVLSLAQLGDGRLVRGRRMGIDLSPAPDFRSWKPLP